MTVLPFPVQAATEGGAEADGEREGDVQRLVNAYVASRMNQGYAATTTKHERLVLTGFAKFMGGRRTARLSQSDIERWMSSMAHLAPGTQRNRYAVVNAFMEHLVDAGKIRRNPCRMIRAPRVPKSRHRALTAEHVSALLAACPDRRAECVVLLG